MNMTWFKNGGSLHQRRTSGEAIEETEEAMESLRTLSVDDSRLDEISSSPSGRHLASAAPASMYDQESNTDRTAEESGSGRYDGLTLPSRCGRDRHSSTSSLNSSWCDRASPAGGSRACRPRSKSLTRNALCRRNAAMLTEIRSETRSGQRSGVWIPAAKSIRAANAMCSLRNLSTLR